jgi:hypothetical protein
MLALDIFPAQGPCKAVISKSIEGMHVAGYSGTPLAKKLGIKENFRILIVIFVIRVKDRGTAENNSAKRKSKA